MPRDHYINLPALPRSQTVMSLHSAGEFTTPEIKFNRKGLLQLKYGHSGYVLNVMLRY